MIRNTWETMTNNKEIIHAKKPSNLTIRPYWYVAFFSVILKGTFDIHGHLRRRSMPGTIITVKNGNNQIISFEPQPSATPEALKWIGIEAGSVE